ncbi:hypothetical protein IV203_008785 [Nitzschia inconspicua]|uniref:Uncharacterized protein n=1 Tax=Nitzschia inconspicua TaxID=303405 RepID=A0A9K3PMD3_9STRA|nr:hypothetical protein IV203_008785 [Nitzschia inconspicua]
MGWHIGMTEEEMREFAGMSCPISNAKENQAHNNNNDDDDDDDNSSRTMSDKQQDDEQAPTRTPEKPKRREKSAANNTTTACPLPPSSLPPPPPPDAQYIYHLCQKAKWDEAVRNNLPYFPPTYMKDGKFTRASVYKEDIVTVANQYYKDTPGKWIVLELDCKLLYSLGIPILAQEAPRAPWKRRSSAYKFLVVFPPRSRWSIGSIRSFAKTPLGNSSN